MKTPKTLIAIILLSALPLRADDGSNTSAPPAPAAPPAAPATVPPPSGSSGASISVHSGGGFGGGGGSFRGTAGGGGGAFGAGNGIVAVDGNRVGGWVSGPDRPTLITTQSIDAQARTQWKEDLNVMDKLLHEEIARVGGPFTPQAMGIALRFAGNSAPMYVEGCGVIFFSSVNLPLAAGGEGAAKKDEKPADADSPWERARIELDTANGRGVQVFSGRATDNVKFEQEKVDTLIDAIVTILPQATHIRSLKPDESVIVTIGGADDAGNSLRLTFKAKKSDIDDAASGKIKPEEFKQRVAQRIG